MSTDRLVYSGDNDTGGRRSESLVAARESDVAGGRVCVFAGARVGDRIENRARCEYHGEWVIDAIELYLSHFELPVLWRMRKAWDKEKIDELKYWNSYYCAGRDTAEARAETLQMGYSLVRLLDDIDLDTALDDVARTLRAGFVFRSRMRVRPRCGKFPCTVRCTHFCGRGRRIRSAPR